jgi:tripartite ATP-independent transporter DctP family solute receptor
MHVFNAIRQTASRGLFVAVLFEMLLLAATDVRAQDVAPRVLRFATGFAKEHPMGLGAIRFAALVASKSDGRINVVLVPDPQARDAQDNLRAVREGHVELTAVSTSRLACIDQQFTLFSLPFLFNNAREAHLVADGPVGTLLLDRLPDHGMVGLGIWELGFHSLTSSRHPIARAEDLRGLRIRSTDMSLHPDVMRILGLRPVPVNHGQVEAELGSAFIDGQDNPVSSIDMGGGVDGQKFMSLTRHVYTGMPLLMHKPTWDAMSDAERLIVREAADQAKREQRERAQVNEALTIDALSDHLQVTALPSAEIDRLRAMVAPVVERISLAVGEFTVKQAAAELARLRIGQGEH